MLPPTLNVQQKDQLSIKNQTERIFYRLNLIYGFNVISTAFGVKLAVYFSAALCVNALAHPRFRRRSAPPPWSELRLPIGARSATRRKFPVRSGSCRQHPSRQPVRAGALHAVASP